MSSLCSFVWLGGNSEPPLFPPEPVAGHEAAPPESPWQSWLTQLMSWWEPKEKEKKRKTKQI